MNWLRALVVRVLRVPPEPHPPAGAPGSVRILRASPRYYRLKLTLWGLKQLGALVAIILLLVGVISIPFVSPPSQLDDEEPPRLSEEQISRLPKPLRKILPRIVNDSDGWVVIYKIVETFSIAGFIIQLPITFAMVRLDYEMRWYIVTDRSLRIREGLQRVREMTLTFANVQDITIVQNPLEALLGIANVRVRTAGGGQAASKDSGKSEEEETAHLGVLRGVDDAPAIRDLILARLKSLRDAGLGDPDDHDTAPVAPTAADGGALAAAREVLEEARALRGALGRTD